MYRIVGADGREYGPISADQLRQWIAEGRANTQTRVLVEGTTEWKTVGELPEFAGPPPGSTLGAPPTMAPIPALLAGADVLQQVNAPAIGLIVVAILGFVVQVAGLIFRVFFSALAARQTENMPAMFSGSLATASGAISILMNLLILFGGIKMKKLENHGLAMAASILAMIPCNFPCCIISLPIGIWAVIVLCKPEVKGAFR
jgi:hypothetical protein